MFRRLLENHVLANLCFVLVLIIGFLSYQLLPREQDPSINFNWLNINTVVPGMAASDIEIRVTEAIEDVIRNVQDIKFVSSTSRDSVSNILVRFEEMEERLFDKRVNDLRREIQNVEDELPEESLSPFIYEVTSANAFPVATLVVVGQANDANLREMANVVKKEIEQIKGVDRIIPTGLRNQEIRILFDQQKLQAFGLSPVLVADTLARNYRDLSAGAAEVDNHNWIVRLIGTTLDPAELATAPLSTDGGEITLGDVARVEHGESKPRHLVRINGKPGVMLAVTKQEAANTLDLVARVDEYLIKRNQYADKTGVTVILADDQTLITRNALNIMQYNALLGLFLVLVVTWLFLGKQMALLTSIGIPFVLAGTFWILSLLGQTLNVTVLLGVVISLGMLVDDAVVVVESIYYRLHRGLGALDASIEALGEVAVPVTTAVLTTMAAFLPLMLLPGILGKFMLVIPLVVTVALAISLVEAFWMLPAHVTAANVNFDNPTATDRVRIKALRWLRIKYVRALVKAMRYPSLTFATLVLAFVSAIAVVGAGKVKVDFFAADPLRLFYVNVQMPPGTPLSTTDKKMQELEIIVRRHVRPGEVRNIVSFSGQMNSETAPFQGTHFGQMLVALQPRTGDLRHVDEMIEAMREDLVAVPGPERTWFLRLAGGPPTSKPINVKVRGEKLDEIRGAAQKIQAYLSSDPAVFDITDDDNAGQMEAQINVDYDAARRAGIPAQDIYRSVRMMVDGEVVATTRNRGEEVEIRVLAERRERNSIDEIFQLYLPTAFGQSMPISELVSIDRGIGLGNIRHYNFRRTITVEADIDKSLTDTLAINNKIIAYWDEIHAEFPNIDLDFTGEFDDIQESMDAIAVLFIFGMGLMFLILGTQFRSYFQPFLVLLTVPMAFTGVTFGLYLTANPMSLFTMYGVVALAGIAVNAAIVLTSAANERLDHGMSVSHSAIYAARRRVVPILITTLTTIAGLFSLATGLAGESLIWGPVATAIVWGLIVSSMMTLFTIPLVYMLTMRFSYRVKR